MVNFDRVAPFYDALAGAVFGGALLRGQRWAIRHALPTDAQQLLFIGGGTGRVLPEILAQAPRVRITYVEASAEMLRRAQARLVRTASATDLARVTFRLGTDADLPSRPTFDAVLTFFLLDVFAPAVLPSVIGRLQTAMVPDAVWLVTDFAPPRTAWQRGLLAVMYRFFGFTAGMQNQVLPDWPAALTAAGWHPAPETTKTFVGGAVRAGGWRRI
jgi:tRNA (cmo5U34)-methyltransferase